MAKRRSIRDLLHVKPTKGQLTLADIDPGTTPGVRKKTARGEMKADQEKLRQLQERLYAEGKRSLLLVLQGMDTSGKDGTIIHVIGAVDPQGVKITGFKAPTEEERRHSKILVYQVLPSRYGMEPDQLRKADAIEIVVGQGATPGGG